MMATVSVQAQDEMKHEVGVFYGFESASNILSIITSSISAATGDQSSFWGPIGVEYYYHVLPVVGVGAVAASLNGNILEDEFIVWEHEHYTIRMKRIEK